jgi:hypothetical protein
MKKYIVVFLIGVILGGVTYKNKNFLTGITLDGYTHKTKALKHSSVKQLGKKNNILTPYAKNILISRYTTGSPFFLDRSYFDQIGDSRLEGLFLIQITRHRKNFIDIEVNSPLTVYRLISESNENDIFNSYIETDIKVKVVGSSSIHTKVLKKDFLKGRIRLPAGGPVSASPILILVKDKNFPAYGFKVTNAQDYEKLFY